MVNHSIISEVYKRSINNLIETRVPCCLCRAPANPDTGICAACAAALPALQGPLCRCALRPSYTENPQHGEICGKCIINPPPFSITEAIYAYNFPLDRIIRSYKHDRHLFLERALAGLWLRGLWQRPPEWPDRLVPLPCHWRRHWFRGFSPAARLARILGRELSLPVDPALERARATPSQQGQGLSGRRGNLRGSMRATHSVKGMHLAVVDDVMTTAATAREAARALRRAGAARVDIWVLARTLEHR